MNWASTLPGVMASLKTTWEAGDLNGGSVILGPVVGTGVLGVLTVAFQDPTGEIVAEGQSQTEGYVSSPSREQYSVNCAASALNGATDIIAAVAVACGLFDAAGTVLAANSRLNDTVLKASIGAWQLSLTQEERGAIASVRFNVDIDAYTTE